MRVGVPVGGARPRRTRPGEPAVRAVRRIDVVVSPPVLGEDLGFEQRVELLAVQVLVPHAAVERFDPGVLPG